MILNSPGVFAQVGHRFGFEFHILFEDANPGFVPNKLFSPGYDHPINGDPLASFQGNGGVVDGQPPGNSQAFSRGIAPLRIKVINHHLGLNPILFIPLPGRHGPNLGNVGQHPGGLGQLVRGPAPNRRCHGEQQAPDKAGQPPTRSSPTGQE